MSRRRCVELGAPGGDLLEQVAQLALLAGLVVVHVDDAADLREVEAEPLAAQDEGEPDPVPGVEDPRPCRVARGVSRPSSS